MQESAPIHVLVVEDEVVNRDVVCQMLTHFGHRVSAVDSGRAALDALRASDFDLVVMDCRMEDIDGLEATRRLRAGEAGERGCRIPIIALTAQAFASDRQACLDAGMNDFLSKPIDVSVLMDAVGRWGRRAASVQAAGSAQGKPGGIAVLPAAVIFDQSVLAALPMVADGTQPAYGRVVLNMYLDSLPQQLATIGRAVIEGDVKTVQRTMHSLKSSSAAVGAMAIAQCAAHAEARLRAGEHQLSHLPEHLELEIKRLREWLGIQQKNATPESAV